MIVCYYHTSFFCTTLKKFNSGVCHSSDLHPPTQLEQGRNCIKQTHCVQTSKSFKKSALQPVWEKGFSAAAAAANGGRWRALPAVNAPVPPLLCSN
jgi:hypothetical protein